MKTRTSFRAPGFFGLAAALLLATPARARDWPSAGGWDVGEIDDGCVMSQDYEGEGETELWVMLGTDRSVLLGAANSNWSSKDGETYDLQFWVNDKGYGGGKAVGSTFRYKKGFLTRMADNFLTDFAAGRSLRIVRDETLVDQLSLAGTGAGVAMLRRCTAALKAQQDAEAREKARFAHIPTDPFAEPKVVGKPLPPRDLVALITADDYPAAAQHAGEQGVSIVRLSVGADGRVTNCVLESSSGSSSLDAATCRLMKLRARYTPARDASGEAVPGEIRHRQTWTLPSE